LENPKFSGDQITLPTSQKRVYGLFKASFFDCTIKFFAAFEKVRVFQENHLLRRDPEICSLSLVSSDETATQESLSADIGTKINSVLALKARDKM
jgi:hypothetical protein